ncbi:hypothetical protein K449DRAFT_188661 [Hypoxylon sp. EC38]|nr:hypothetical protein K449DRAFT_188661 [Hypoxylon sp. EC38]
MGSSSGSQGNQQPSWATIVGNQSPDGKDGNVAAPTPTQPAKVAFKPKGGKNWTNYKNGQRFQQSQQSRSFHPSNSTRPPATTFRDQYLQQVQDAEQSASHTPEPIKQPLVLTQDAQSSAHLNTELASLKATVATLNDDLSRRSSDLIQAKTDLAIRDSEIESLKNTIAMLNQKLDSTAAADKANYAKFTAKDNMIKKLQYENASLRDAIHTGVMSIAQIYGPGTTQAFTKIASKEADMIEQEAAKGFSNGNRNVQPTQRSPNNSSHVSKQNGGPPHGQSTRNGRVDIASKKTQKQNQHVRDVAILTVKEDDRPSDVSTTVTTDVTDHLVKKVDVQGEEIHPAVEDPAVEENHTPTKDNPADENLDLPALANDSSSEQNAVVSSNVDVTPDNHDAPAVKSSDLSPNEGVKVENSPLSEARAPSTIQTQDPYVLDEKNDNADVSSPSQVNDDISTVHGNVDAASGKYAFKGQESTDLTHGVIGTNAHASTISSSSQVEHGTMGNDTPNSYWGARPNNGIKVILINAGITRPTGEINPNISAAEQTDPTNDKPTENNGGWVNVQAKNRHRNKARGKAKQKADVTENQTPEPKANDNAPNATKPALKEKGVPAKAPKRWTQKPNGTVIGSNSVFSQAANKQQNEHDAGKGKEGTRKVSDGSSSSGKKRERTGSPARKVSNSGGSPARSTNEGKKPQIEKSKAAGSKKDGNPSTGLSWADEMDEADAKLKQTSQ